nr:hypothetical protein [Tanacetum cinerariifolium]
MPFEEGKIPIKYLGVLLISSRLLHKDCKILVEIVQKRIGDWKNKWLSFTGGHQLVLSIISSMHLYWASIFILPAGGLGIIKLADFNIALMPAHIWKILTHKETLWVRWIHAYKLKTRSFWDVHLGSNKGLHLYPCHLGYASMNTHHKRRRNSCRDNKILSNHHSIPGVLEPSDMIHLNSFYRSKSFSTQIKRSEVRHFIWKNLRRLISDLFSDPVTLVDDHLDTRMGETREEFMNFLSASLTDRITEQVRNQPSQILPDEVSNFAPPVIEKMIQESLNQVNLEKASSQPRSTYEAAATLT